MSIIEVRQLAKSYRVHQKEPGLKGSLKALFRREWLDKQALKGVSLDVSEGEILGLVGANGAGKTTLVKALAGIIHPTSGEARVLGYTPWERRTEFRRQIALIMGQKAQLWWDLPASDCFILLREIYRIEPKEFQKTLDYLVDTLDVRAQLNIQIRRLSLGERMKMELIAALLHRPRVVFLDEPTIGLDLTSQRAIRKFLLEYREQFKPAMILTSHYMEDIERLCGRIAIIREGEMVYDGPLAGVTAESGSFRIVTAKLAPEAGAAATDYGSALDGAGEVLSATAEAVKFKVRREKVAEAAGRILKALPVADLTIEEEDIGTIIESIMRKRAAPVKS